ncbi:hypothetical protein [Ferruginibacter profundus]
MNERLAKRKENYTRYLREEFEKKPQRWWQQRTAEYIATADAGGGNRYQPDWNEIIIRYDLKRALKQSALFVIINFLIVFIVDINRKEINASFLFFNFLIFIVMLCISLGAYFKGPYVIFNSAGFWINGMEKRMPWQNLVASYIKIDDNGESASYYLQLHYYDEGQDCFVYDECTLDGLEIQREEIAFYIECWKMKIQ